jgi:hypothetical protein
VNQVVTEHHATGVVMRNVARVVALALALVCLGTPAVTGPATAGTGPSIANLTVDPGPFRVDGLLGTAVATVSVDVHEPSGVTGCTDSPGPGGDVLVRLTRTADGPSELVDVWLSRTSGTDVDGTWSAPWRIASTRGGTWTVTRVSWCNRAGLDSGWTTDPRVNPGVVRTVQVVGTHVPRITMTRVPAVVAYGARQDVVYTFYGSSGRPLRNHPVTYGDDTNCGMDGNGAVLRNTDASGRLVVRTEGMQCVYLSNPPTAHLGKYAGVTLLAKLWVQRYEYVRWVSVHPSATVVRSGHPVAIIGVVAPTPTSYPGRWTVGLQRLVGRTWRGVAVATVRSSGRYTLTLTRAGSLCRQTYRVLVRGPASWSFAPTPSRTFVVTGR